MWRLFLVNPRETYHWGDLDIEGNIILKWIIKKYDVLA
jgi:hypothetical protein